MSKEFAWSYSNLKVYEQCPRQYYEVHRLKKHPYKESPATKEGKEVHKAVELYVTNGVPFSQQHARYQPVVDAVLAKPGKRKAEMKMALNRKLQPTGYFDKDVWVRGQADLTLLETDRARVVDWKTGSAKYPDIDQLDLMGLMTMAYYPEVKQVNSALIFLKADTIVKSKLTSDQVAEKWWSFRERTAKIEASIHHDVWNPQQGPLCPWCPCTSCEFHPKHHSSE